MATAAYTAKDIEVLEGLDPVRKRPAMYIGSTDHRGLHQLVWEILDNSVDEVINGYASRIDVVLEANGQEIVVADNGRGIPVDRHEKYRKPALELIMTTLHAGGKFGHTNYRRSGGLHGVGASVVNALSKSMRVTIHRDGYEWTQVYRKGSPAGAVQRVRPVSGSCAASRWTAGRSSRGSSSPRCGPSSSASTPKASACPSSTKNSTSNSPGATPPRP